MLTLKSCLSIALTGALVPTQGLSGEFHSYHKSKYHSATSAGWIYRHVINFLAGRERKGERRGNGRFAHRRAETRDTRKRSLLPACCWRESWRFIQSWDLLCHLISFLTSIFHVYRDILHSRSWIHGSIKYLMLSCSHPNSQFIILVMAMWWLYMTWHTHLAG